MANEYFGVIDPWMPEHSKVLDVHRGLLEQEDCGGGHEAPTAYFIQHTMPVYIERMEAHALEGFVDTKACFEETIRDAVAGVRGAAQRRSLLAVSTDMRAELLSVPKKAKAVSVIKPEKFDSRQRFLRAEKSLVKAGFSSRKARRARELAEYENTKRDPKDEIQVAYTYMRGIIWRKNKEYGDQDWSERTCKEITDEWERR